MNEIIELLNKYNYKVKKIKIKNNLNIITTEQEKYVIKENKNKNIRDLFNYLESKNYNNYLDYLNDDQDNFIIYPYINEVNETIEEKTNDILILMATLHLKTVYKKNVTGDEINKHYEKLLEKIEKKYNYYDSLRKKLEEQDFLSPSKYYMLVNISWIFHSLDSSKFFLNKWKDIITPKKYKRMVLNHGNLELNHLIIGKNKYLINWEKSENELPINDLEKFYKNNYMLIDCKEMLTIYEKYFALLEEEKYLFYSKILIPFDLDESNSEINNTINIYNLMKYLQISSNIISNDYSSNSNYEENNKYEQENSI